MTESTLRKHAVSIFRAGLRAADPVQAVLRHVQLDGDRLIVGRKQYPLDRFRRIFVVGAGKAAAPMAQALERLLGSRVDGGLVNVKYGHSVRLKRVKVNECGHPVPDEAGVDGARRIAHLLSELTASDLVLNVISGGASALLPLPADPIKLEEKQRTTELLLASGASIHEVNAVRKHISGIKGGQLARLARPATLVSLLLSDVTGDDPDVIGSGPGAPDKSTFSEARETLDRYGILEQVPRSVRERIHQGVAGDIPETPKPGAKEFARADNHIVGSNLLAVNACAERATALGLRTQVLSTFVEGETREIARMHAAIARELRTHKRPLRPPACLISGGETTVTIHGDGLGGRNQEFVLAAAIDLDGLNRVVVLSGGTDGTDGPTDAAGAIADGRSVTRGRELGLDARARLDANDSYHFFEPLGDLLKTGPTRTNVMDIQIVLVG